MRTSTRFVRLIAGISVGVGLLAGTAGVVSAGAATGTGSITVHLRTCDATFAGDFFAECHDNPVANIPFELIGPMPDQTAPTGADGNVAFINLPEGDFQLTGGVPGEFAETTIFCSDADDVSIAKAFTLIPGGIDLELAEGEAVVCDFYAEPFDLSGRTPTVAPPAATTATGGTTTLPSTGTGDSGGTGAIGLWAAVAAALALGGIALVNVRRAFR
ncbi:MAG: hypothetical protein M3R06_02455 [Chloroflexota bacterium]|nr:hypothetical protein [Chloroflexota bacterium]